MTTKANHFVAESDATIVTDEIIPEDRLAEIFDTLPAIDGGNDPDVTPEYDFGTETQLYQFLESKLKEKKYPYPLIWAETPIETDGDNERVTFELPLIIVTRTEAKFSNRERLKRTVKQRLIPTLKNIKIALKESGFTTILGDTYKKSVFYNYGSQDETSHQSAEIWDAIKIKMQIAMTDDKSGIGSDHY